MLNIFSRNERNMGRANLPRADCPYEMSDRKENREKDHENTRPL